MEIFIKLNSLLQIKVVNARKEQVSIIGATGYVGVELLRLLSAHPAAEIVHITSESHAGASPATVYPHLHGRCPLALEPMSAAAAIAADSEVLFVALPHGHAI